MSFLLLTGMTVSEKNSKAFDYFENYNDGYYLAKKLEKPLLVILNPGRGSDKTPIKLSDVRKTRDRRAMLPNFVVVVIDTGTKHGQSVHGLFGSKNIPRVVVIDREQKFQIFQSDRTLQGDDWNRILDTFKTGDTKISLDLDAVCFT